MPDTSIASTSPLRGLARRLVEDGLLSEAAARQAHEAADAEECPLLHYITREGLVGTREAALATAWEYGLACVDLEAIPLVNLPDLTGMSESLLRRLGALPLARHPHRLVMAIDTPSALPRLDELQFSTGLSVEAVLAPVDQLGRYLEQYLELHGEGAMALLGNSESLDALTLEDDQENEGVDAAISDKDDAPVVRFVKQLMLDAIRRGASDVHFEPYETSFRVRFRIDGLLIEAARPPIGLRSRITTRLKVLARLDISERRLPQDGTIKMRLSARRSVDFRVNTLPTLSGEKIVLRLLDPAEARLGIEALGFLPEQQACYEAALARPQGMILVTGPTGSGKTVTLYTGLNILNTEERNIATAEDPVELRLEGINQVNVQPRIGLDFANALRAFLRQDPDVVMVGEIRDLETAEVAVKAAQTGHLVLSTLHTNSAAETLTRLRNMGVAAFNIASSVSLIIAQRLARRLCSYCREPVEIPVQVLREAGASDEEIHQATLYQAHGCDRCTNGYRGRVGIYEVMPISATMSRLIMQEVSAAELAEQAHREGRDDLRRSGLRKVLAGETTLEEINRITSH
ncbi:type IV-A pilus assembly ATPase PilB [Kushneria phosphatilytica]|uniref:Type IV-A pilus assembly ATPase PilB n=1 Tax=Kushneria phosphatilytica TaxID=657387 RepID=A0A1S1P160_9GAMM|nr:type IV-A pilus assembly ATPase PilB [Kushneria phosphatilytica]OHV12215.1 type IV-A pilus assembly ATPase PilB [Kushneria phosphatilytica]QEL11410.1 type IV-A pilus assembly ATPase PilB [Kushneria phosphatilytica]